MNKNHEFGDALDQQFPMLYITLVSMVIALSAERLLSRMSDMTFSISLEGLVILLQCGYSIILAALLWWVSSRWVSTIGWRFRFFDGLSMFMMLIGFDLVAGFIDNNFGYWLLTLGIFVVGSGLMYRYNGLEGMRMRKVSKEIVDLHVKPTYIMIAFGAVLLVIGIFVPWEATSSAIQLVVIALAYGMTWVFGKFDLAVWEVAAEYMRERTA